MKIPIKHLSTIPQLYLRDVLHQEPLTVLTNVNVIPARINVINSKTNFMEFLNKLVRKIRANTILNAFATFPFLRKSFYLRSRVVYRKTCSCDDTYISQTRRNLIARLQEHDPGNNRCSNTDGTKHLHPSHIIDLKIKNLTRTRK